MKTLNILIICLYPCLLGAQGYTNWIIGDQSDATNQTYKAGIVLAGGGGDSDAAMQWMLERAGGGDVLVIRASNSDGYNDYFYQELGISVNSVETIRFEDKSASSDPYVLEQLNNAEVLFIAGGDQYDYYQLWKDTPVEDVINDLINVKGITVGGTSAGMAILSKMYYTPSGGSLDTEEALSNPFHPDVDILGKDDFLNVPFLDNVITDTHYDQRDRPGRHLTFLARALNDFATNRSYGIACNEYTVVAIDEQGMARVFGAWPEYDDYAYFLRSNCQSEFLPELLEEGEPLTWNRQQAAVHVYKVPGNILGENYVNLASPEWEEYSGAALQNWYAIDGNFSQIDVDDPGCASIVSVNELSGVSGIGISPNPVVDVVRISTNQDSKSIGRCQLFSILGERILDLEIAGHEWDIDLSDLPSGAYILRAGKDRIPIQKM